MCLPQHLLDATCTGFRDILIKPPVLALSEASRSWKPVSPLVTLWLGLGSLLQGTWSGGGGAARACGLPGACRMAWLGRLHCPCMAAVGPGCPQPGLLPASPGSSPCLVTVRPERAGTSCGSGIGPPLKASYLCSFPRALNFAYVSGKRAAALGQSTASSQRGESAFNFSSDFPSLFSLIPPAITE